MELTKPPSEHLFGRYRTVGCHRLDKGYDVTRRFHVLSRIRCASQDQCSGRRKALYCTGDRCIAALQTSRSPSSLTCRMLAYRLWGGSGSGFGGAGAGAGGSGVTFGGGIFGACGPIPGVCGGTDGSGFIIGVGRGGRCVMAFPFTSGCYCAFPANSSIECGAAQSSFCDPGHLAHVVQPSCAIHLH